jgi:hypothetical protein
VAASVAAVAAGALAVAASAVVLVGGRNHPEVPSRKT